MKNNDFNNSPELNITPLVDIMLVLLAILMVTTPALLYEEKISLPEGSKTNLSSGKKDDLIIRIDIDKNIYLGNQKFLFEEFADNIQLLADKYQKNKPVFIRADRKLMYGDVMKVLADLTRVGFKTIAFETTDR